MPVGRLGPFELEEPLGGRERPRVFRAIHPGEGKQVALKRFSIPLLAGNVEAQRRLLEDFELLKKLDHPALAKSFGGFLKGQDACYAYELVHGESVEAVLDRRARMTWEQAWDVVEPMAHLLNYLHARDVYAGAFFPDRVLFDALGSPRLVSLTGLWDRERRRPGTLERRFIAPEIREEETPTAKSDLWSLGALAYACVTGAPPPEDAARAVEPPSMMIEAPDCPYWFDRIVLQMLAPDPAARPYNAGTVSLALQEGRKRLGERAGVAEHVARGFSPIRVDASRVEPDLPLSVRKRDEEDENRPNIEIGQVFSVFAVGGLTVFLIALIGLISWMIMPKPDDRRLVDTAAMLESGDRYKIRQAHDILEPIYARHPDDELTEEARRQLDFADMYLAEEALRIRREYDRPFKTEAERLYAKGREMEELGDRVGALEQYKSLLGALDPESDDRVYYKLAERDALRLEREGATTEQAEFVQERLDEAERLFESGRIAEARRLWQSIVSLYRDDEHLLPLVKQAESYLRQTEDAPGA